MTVLCISAAIASGLIAGVFFAFSCFVMQALARMPQQEGARAMQFINATVLNPMFLGVFTGAAVLSAVASVLAFVKNSASAIAIVVASTLYVFGCFGVTALCNVPLNKRLAVTNRDTPEGSVVWSSYQRDWTRWNHVRTIASLLASIGFIIAGIG